MKILLIDVNCKSGSTGKIVYDLYTDLTEQGENVAICYGRGSKINDNNIYKFGLDIETKIHAGLARVTGFNGCFSPISTKRVIDYIEEFKPDLIHIHELHAYFVNIKPLIEYIKENKIPVVWTFHCEYMYTGKCGYAYDCEKWKIGCESCPAVTDYPKSMLFDWTKAMYRTKKQLLRDLDFTIVTPSQWLADRVKLSFLGNRDIRVIHNGIDTDSVFYPRITEEIKVLKNKYHLENKKIVLAVAPNIMEERKGGKQVLQIACQMPELQFVLVGADEDKRYSDNVLMIKRTKDQDELARWYSMADLFLICSKKENFPTTCLEALSCGTPIVGIDEGGTKETAPYPYGKFVGGGGTTELLQKEISTQLSIGFVRDEIRNAAVQLYSKSVMCDAYRLLYKELLNQD
mgnify:CR=1 FL=1